MRKVYCLPAASVHQETPCGITRQPRDLCSYWGKHGPFKFCYEEGITIADYPMVRQCQTKGGRQVSPYLKAEATLTLLIGFLILGIGLGSTGSSASPRSSASRAVRGDALRLRSRLRSRLSSEDERPRVRLWDGDLRLGYPRSEGRRPRFSSLGGMRLSCAGPLWYPLSCRMAGTLSSRGLLLGSSRYQLSRESLPPASPACGDQGSASMLILGPGLFL